MEKDAQAKQKRKDPELPSYMTKGRVSTPAVRGYSSAYAKGGNSFANNNQPQSLYNMPEPMMMAGQARPENAASRGASNTARKSKGSANSGGGKTNSASAKKQGSRSGGGGGGRKKKLSKSQKLMRYVVAVFGALIIVVGAILLLSNNGFASPSGNVDYLDSDLGYFDGIIIEGVDASNKTIDEIKPLVQQAVSARMNEVSISLIRDDNSWSITAADMGLTANVDDLLNEAMAYGRSGSISENAEIKQNLKKENKEFFISFGVNAEALENRLNALSAEIGKPPVEPHMIPTLTEDIKASFEPVQGQNGEALDVSGTARLIEESISKREYNAKIEPMVLPVEPTMSMEFIQENTSFISSFFTDYEKSSSKELVINRCFNIEKAATIINGLVVQPGAVWSFNDYVGPRTKDNGWMEANGISGGKEFTRQYGGGICQVSTTLYGALLRGNIKIPDGGRKKHSIPSTYAEKGQDATVDTSGIDLYFENDTGAPLYVFVYIKNHPERSGRLRITVSLYGKPLPEGVTYVPRSVVEEPVARTNPVYVDDPMVPIGYELTMIEMRPKYKAEVFLDKFVDKKLVESKYLYTDEYRGNEAQIHRGTGDPLTVPVPEGAIPVFGTEVIPENFAAQDEPVLE